MTRRPRKNGFTLVELLVVIAIIALLTSILLPSLSNAKEQARNAQCLATLHGLGVAMNYYCSDYNGSFWSAADSRPTEDGSFENVYFWGRSVKVSDTTYELDAHASEFMKYLNYDATRLWCPNQPWEDIPSPQASVRSTNYGYNGYCLDPEKWQRTWLKRKSMDRVKRPQTLFVFADSGMYWSSNKKYQNSTWLDPIEIERKPGQLMYNGTPTNHFRHLGRSNALTVDGHVEGYYPSDWRYSKSTKLGFVGTANDPHYDQ